MPVLVLFAVLIVAGASIFVRTEHTKTASPETTLPSPTQTPTPTLNPSPSLAPQITLVPTTKPKSITTPDSHLSTWVYPGSTLFSNNIYLSQDSPQQITDWYKNKIRSEGFNIKNFITTSANEKIENKLTGSNNNQSTEVSITRSPGDNHTKIILVLDIN